MDFFLTIFLYRRIAHRLTHIALERKRAPVVVAFYFLFQKHTRSHTHHLLIQVSYFRHIGEYAYTLDIHDTVGMENEDNISESWLDAHWAGTIDAFVILAIGILVRRRRHQRKQIWTRECLLRQ